MLRTDGAEPDSVDLRAAAQVVQEFVVRANKHIGGGLSSVEMLVGIFFGGAGSMSPSASPRDNLVLSKGHAPAAYYFCLWLSGYFPDLGVAELLSFGDLDHRLPRMPQRRPDDAIDMSTGSLGQGLSFANGLAAADRKRGVERRTFVVLGDAECTEGQIWEAADSAARMSLSSVTALVDANGFGSGITVPRSQWADKWRAFGWAVHELDGHDVEALVDALQTPADRPAVIIAHTVKGRGLEAGLEGTNRVHNSAPPDSLRVSPHFEAKALELRQILSPPSPVSVDEPAGGDSDEAWQAPIAVLGDIAHPKKIGGSLLDYVSRSNRLALVSPDAIGNSGLKDILTKCGSWSWENYQSPVFEMWIAEQDCASFAAGLTANGVRAAVFMMEGFVWRMLDSIRESIAFQGLPAVIVATSGGLGDSLGPMVQSDACYAAITSLPGLDIFEAADFNAAGLFLEHALVSDRPTYIRLPHEELTTIYDPAEQRRYGVEQGAWLAADVPDPTGVILAAGSMVHQALAAAEELRQEGIRCRVVDVFSPPRFAGLASQIRSEFVPPGVPCVTAHNSAAIVLGSLVDEPKRVLALDDYGTYGKPLEAVYDRYGLNSTHIAQQMRSLIGVTNETSVGSPVPEGSACDGEPGNV